MLQIPYNVKSAELPAPHDQSDYHRDLVGYTEYKALYDAFVNDMAPFAADQSRWTDPAFQEYRLQLEQLMQTLSECAYVKYMLPAMKVYKSLLSRHVSLTYHRLLMAMFMQ